MEETSGELLEKTKQALYALGPDAVAVLAREMQGSSVTNDKVFAARDILNRMGLSFSYGK